ncbi:hypothetical protein [Clostridium grantii]|nr:hypothetical protein [Clostridium grantii]
MLDDTTGIKFIMEEELFENYGDIKIIFTGRGFSVAPANKGNSYGSC